MKSALREERILREQWILPEQRILPEGLPDIALRGESVRAIGVAELLAAETGLAERRLLPKRRLLSKMRLLSKRRLLLPRRAECLLLQKRIDVGVLPRTLLSVSVLSTGLLGQQRQLQLLQLL